jgi:hypothetical protein
MFVTSAFTCLASRVIAISMLSKVVIWVLTLYILAEFVDDLLVDVVRRS